MKKLFPLFFLFFCGNALFAQIPNANMEFWDNQPVLLQWETNSRPLTAPPFNPYIVVQDTDHYSGTYSANLIGNNVFHSWARTTFAITQHPASLTLYYKLNFPPCVNDPGYFEQDTVSVLVEILHNSAVVDQGYWEISGGSNMLWSQLTIPVSNNSSTFDSCRITMTGGKIFGGCGFVAAATEFKVDHLSLNNLSSCSTTGIVRDGVEISCLLIDTGTANWLFPCNISMASLGFAAGDTIHFSFIANQTCVSFCQQGTSIDLTCIDTGGAQPVCNLSVSLQIHNPTSYMATNGWMHALVNNGTSPYSFVWSNGVSGVAKDSITGLGEGNYCVTVSDANNCTAAACDSLAGAHVCVDSALIVGPTCPAIFDPVCGCDSVTYLNSCEAEHFHGITNWVTGACSTNGIKNIVEGQMELLLSPVPANDKLSIVYGLKHSGKTSVRILDALGEMVKILDRGFEISGRYQMDIDLNNFAAGIYFVEVKTEVEGKIKMFVKE